MDILSFFGYSQVRYLAHLLEDQSLCVSLVDIPAEHATKELALRNQSRLQSALKAARAGLIDIDTQTGQLVVRT